MSDETKGQMSAREAGRRGGATTRGRYGSDFYAEAGREGGTETLRRHGIEYYKKMGALGGQRVRELIAAGRRAEEGQE